MDGYERLLDKIKNGPVTTDEELARDTAPYGTRRSPRPHSWPDFSECVLCGRTFRQVNYARKTCSRECHGESIRRRNWARAGKWPVPYDPELGGINLGGFEE